MSTRTRAAHDLPADVETVLAVLTGPDWAPTLADRLGDDSRALRCEPTPDGGALVEVSRRLPQGVPGFLQRFLPEDGRVVQTDRWQPATGGTRSGTWTVGFPGAPGSIGGTTRLEPTSGGCRWVVEGEVQVRIPIVGRRAEAFLAPLVEKLVARQAEVLREVLAAR